MAHPSPSSSNSTAVLTDQKTEEILVSKAGGPKRLKLTTVEMPRPGDGELLIEMEAAGVAFADLAVREGQYPNATLPAVPGYDIVGRITAIGEGVEGFEIGERIGALTEFGSYTRHRTIPAQWAVKMPTDSDPAELVALILNYTTAYQLLHRCARVQSGDWALVHGAAGGVGQALMQLSALEGVKTIGTSSAGKQQVVEQLGGIHIDYNAKDFVDEVMRITSNEGVDAAFDAIGGKHVQRSYNALSKWGTVVTYGLSSAFSNSGRFNILRAASQVFQQPRFKPLNLLSDNRGIVGYGIAGRRNSRPERLNEDLSTLIKLHGDGLIKPQIAMRLPLEKAAEAQTMLGNRKVTGKIVLVPSSDFPRF